LPINSVPGIEELIAAWTGYADSTAGFLLLAFDKALAIRTIDFLDAYFHYILSLI
jgi:hypothetical protein